MKTRTLTIGSAVALATIAGWAADDPTWDGGGADEKLTTKENWAGDVLPALTDGSTAPLFATAGSRALADIASSFYGLTFGGASTAFELAGDRVVTVGAGGVAVADAHAAVVSTPMAIQNAQTWSVGSDATLILSNAVSDLDAA